MIYFKAAIWTVVVLFVIVAVFSGFFGVLTTSQTVGAIALLVFISVIYLTILEKLQTDEMNKEVARHYQVDCERIERIVREGRE